METNCINCGRDIDCEEGESNVNDSGRPLCNICAEITWYKEEHQVVLSDLYGRIQ